MIELKFTITLLAYWTLEALDIPVRMHDLSFWKSKIENLRNATIKQPTLE